ncbi:mammalian cell entry protein [Mycobacterium sp. MS1601]|uniref:MCE family protein n=1 Tax=Mycobacterium sp. MS1601 TaxID=1936029 RepID=UPI0009797EBD|nr:MlaD family protein [Mycobacterium sp. MS1601]AQA05450.1 mammalian cell entry protein [Mycobacterium sp. MS1601]
MRLTRRLRIQLAVLLVIGLTAAVVMAINYVKVPALLGIGQYRVIVELPESAGLYPSGNVTYRGVTVGRVDDVRLTTTGVEAVLALRTGTDIPSDLDAEVHSQSAVGEQYVALLPRSDAAQPLRDGDVIPLSRTTIPADLNELLDATNAGLLAIPGDDLRTAIDESATAVAGLGPELSRLIDGATGVAIDARDNLGPLITLIDKAAPVLDSQADTAADIQAWSSHVAELTAQLRDNDAAVAGIVQGGGPATDEVRALLDRVQPTVPILLANLVSIGEVALEYNASLEQILVLFPQGTAIFQQLGVPTHGTGLPPGGYLDFNLNFNLPPPCTTGFLPAQQRRAPALEDAPDRPAGDLYCRIPQDSMFNVRGVRNIPCQTVPGKRAPTVKMCESDESYVPLNDGMAWKGDPNATLSGQPIPQVASVEYDPATGTYLAPGGTVGRRPDLAAGVPTEKTWESLLVPPGR